MTKEKENIMKLVKKKKEIGRDAEKGMRLT